MKDMPGNWGFRILLSAEYQLSVIVPPDIGHPADYFMLETALMENNQVVYKCGYKDGIIRHADISEVVEEILRVNRLINPS